MVYRCGFAGSQQAYDAAFTRLFDSLDWLSDRLADQRFLVGDTITEADVRLFTTLARFDAVYHGRFKCNRTKLTELPVLWAYARDLFQTRVSVTPPISCRSSSTTTSCTPASTRPGSSRTASTCSLVHRARPGSAGRPTVRRRNAPADPTGGRDAHRQLDRGDGRAGRSIGRRPRRSA